MEIVKRRIGSVINDVILTGISSALTTLGLLLVFQIIGMNQGPKELGSYGLSRQLVSFLIPLLSLGLCNAVVRFLALSSDTHQQKSYFLAAFRTITFTSALASLCALLIPQQIRQILGPDWNTDLIQGTVILLTGLSFTNLLIAYYRGLGKTALSNIWLITLCAVAPVTITLTERKTDAETIILYTGIACQASIFPLIWHYKSKISPRQTKPCLKQLLSYSLPRIPGGFAIAGLFALPPIVASRLLDTESAGHILIGLIVFRILDGIIGPIGTVIMPRVARLVGFGDWISINKQINNVASAVISISVFLSFYGWLWADTIIPSTLGSEFRSSISTMRVCILSLVPYSTYCLLQAVLDGASAKAINTRNLLIALLVMCLGFCFFPLFPTLTFIPYVSALSYGLLGALTIWEVNKIFKTTFFDKSFVFQLGINFAIFITSYYIKSHMAELNLIHATIFLFFTFLIFITMCYIGRTPWVIELFARRNDVLSFFKS